MYNTQIRVDSNVVYHLALITTHSTNLLIFAIGFNNRKL